ncbi:MAG: hypothetical protein JG781_2630, partial [Peptococcaceae bacterium]|nr:hypothetical protein [Peptococcaceae bacterium]
LEPPLTVSYEAIDRVIAALEEILGHSGFTGVMLSSVRTAVATVFKR